MSNKRYIRLDKFGISQERYKELSAFCMQYNEWKDANRGAVSPKALNKMRLVNTVAEKCSIAVIGDTGLAEYIVKNVTEERPYYYLRDIMLMPYRDKDFYNARRQFFIMLNDVKEGV